MSNQFPPSLNLDPNAFDARDFYGTHLDPNGSNVTISSIDPFTPEIRTKVVDNEIESYEVFFNQGFVFNTVSETQYARNDITTIDNMDVVHELDLEHSKFYYVEVVIDAENFLISAATFMGVDEEDPQPDSVFPEIIFEQLQAEGSEKDFYTGYFPILHLKNGNILEFTTRDNIVLSDRQHKQLGDSVPEESAHILVSGGKELETNPVRHRAISGGSGITVTEGERYIIIETSGASGSTYGNCGDLSDSAADWWAYVAETSQPARFRGLKAGSGITFSSSADGCVTTINAETGCCTGFSGIELTTIYNVNNHNTYITYPPTSNSIEHVVNAVPVMTQTPTLTTFYSETDSCATTAAHGTFELKRCGVGTSATAPTYKQYDASNNQVVSIDGNSSNDTYFNAGPVAVGQNSATAGTSLDIKGKTKIQDASTATKGVLQFGNNENQIVTVELNAADGKPNILLGEAITAFRTSYDDTPAAKAGTPFQFSPDQAAAYSAQDAYIIGSSPATGSAILAGSGNSISGHYNVIVAGANNIISGKTMNFIGGGSGIDIIDSAFSVSVGGRNNDITGSNLSVIGGGENNYISGHNSNTIGGGVSNKIVDANYSTIAGGHVNVVSGNSISSSSIAGGTNNKLYATYGFIGAGGSNTIAGGQGAVIVGGAGNIVSGQASFVGGGINTFVSGNNAVGLGNYSKVKEGHDGAFVFTDSITTPVYSTGANTMHLKFKSGVYITTDSGLYINGNAVLTGETPEGDTLQTVTSRGNLTTTDIISEGEISGASGLFNSTVGIGTNAASVNAPLTVEGDGATSAEFREGGVKVRYKGTEGVIALSHVGAEGRILASKPNWGQAYPLKIAADYVRICTSGGSAATEIARFTDSGNVGIGISDPSKKLEILSADNAFMTEVLKVSSNNEAQYTALGYSNLMASHELSLFTLSDNPISFRPNSVEKMHLTTAGDLGIGTDAPATKLDVVGTGRFHSVDITGSSTLTVSGDVGIGTDAPSHKLNVAVSDSDDGIILQKAGSSNDIFRVTMDGTSDQGEIFLYDGGQIEFAIRANTNHSFINTPANFGIGTTAPAYKLDVSGAIAGTSGNFESGITVNGNPVLTGTSAYETDTLQTVTDDGNTTTNSVHITNAGFGADYAPLTVSGGYGGGTAPLAFFRGTGTTAYIQCQNSTTSYGSASHHGLTVGNNGNDAYVMQREAAPLYLGTSGEARITIAAGGKVGIGSLSPAYPLEVVSVGGDAVKFSRSAAGTFKLRLDAAGGGDTQLQFQNGGADKFTIGSDNTDGSFRIAEGGALGTDDRLTIDADGLVGIGTNNPSKKLHVVGTTRPMLIESDNATNIFKLGNSAVGVSTYNGMDLLVNSSVASSINAYGMPLTFGTSTGNGVDVTERVRIGTGGSVGIGSTTPSEKLDVNGSIILRGSTNHRYKVANDSNNNWAEIGNDGASSQNTLEFFTKSSSVPAMSITNDDRVGIGITNPSHPLQISGAAHIESGNTLTEDLFTIKGGGSVGDYDLLKVEAANGDDLFTVGGFTYDVLMPDSDTNVGIGTTTASAKVHLNGPSAGFSEILRLQRDGGNYYSIGLDNGDLNFCYNGQSADGSTLVIDGAADSVGIGTKSPSTELDVAGTGSFKRINIYNSTYNANPRLCVGRNDNEAFKFYVDDMFTKITAHQDLDGDGDHRFIIDREFAGTGNNSFHIANSGNYQLTIDRDNKIGMGYNYPSNFSSSANRLVIGDGAGAEGMTIYTDTSSSASIYFADGTAGSETYRGWVQYRHANDRLDFGAGAGRRMVVDGNGVGIGTFTVTSKLEVTGALSDSLAKFKDGNDGVEIATRGASRQQIDFLGSNTSTINAKGSLFINYDTDNNGSNDTITFARNGEDAAGTADMVITEGNVGIGTTAPAQKLHVEFANTDTSFAGGGGGDWGSEGLLIENTSSNTSTMAMIQLRNGDADIHIAGIRNGTDDSDLGFFFEASEKVRFTNDGKVGIGTSSPSYELDVNGTTRSTYYIGGAYLEENVSSSKLKFYTDGTVLVMDEDGSLKPCEEENDTLVFGVSKKDFDQPVVLGAEPVLVTGPIKVGDYIVTSSKQGHGQAMKEEKLGTIIAQAMENGDGESYNIKAMVRKM